MTALARDVVNGRGIYYAWESSDGAGKTTQIEIFRKLLEARRPETVVGVDLPSKTRPIGMFLRSGVLAGEFELDPNITQNMMALDLADMGRHEIRPVLGSGRDVISSRSTASNIAYSVALGIPMKTVQGWHTELEILQPDLVFYLRVRPETAMERIEKRGEQKTLYEKQFDTQKRVLEVLDQIAKEHPETWIVLNGDQPIKKIAEDAERAWKSFLSLHDLLERYNLQPA